MYIEAKAKKKKLCCINCLSFIFKIKAEEKIYFLSNQLCNIFFCFILLKPTLLWLSSVNVQIYTIKMMVKRGENINGGNSYNFYFYKKFIRPLVDYIVQLYT